MNAIAGVTEVKLFAHEKRQVAVLEEVARRAVRNRMSTERAVSELRRVSTDPVLLGVAAGRASGRWAAIPLFHSIGQEIAELLVEAGADSDVYGMTASSVERKLRRQIRRG